MKDGFEYLITTDFRFSEKYYYIGIGGKNLEKTFTDDEIIIVIGDILTHEHIHKAIYDLFGNEILTRLFDAIEQYFDTCRELTIKFLKSEGLITWEKALKEDGFKHFLERYNIDKSLLINAQVVCERRYNDNTIRKSK